jgi:hypothetical protein
MVRVGDDGGDDGLMGTGPEPICWCVVRRDY